MDSKKSKALKQSGHNQHDKWCTSKKSIHAGHQFKNAPTKVFAYIVMMTFHTQIMNSIGYRVRPPLSVFMFVFFLSFFTQYRAVTINNRPLVLAYRSCVCFVCLAYGLR